MSSADCVRPQPPELVSIFGPVGSSEVLARIVANPQHIGKNGVKASVIPPTHLRKGLSVIRVGFLCRKPFEEITSAIAANLSGNTIAGFLLTTAEGVRSFQDINGNLALCVFDDATERTEEVPENQAHAIICTRRDYSDEELLALKTEMMECLFSGWVELLPSVHPC